MKFCPYCGVSLPGNAASFCPECGKPLPNKKAVSTRQQRKLPSHPRPHQKPRPRTKPVNPMDINYDGYYDDIQPVDAGIRREGVDPELVKRIILVILGAVGVIVLAIILMMLL